MHLAATVLLSTSGSAGEPDRLVRTESNRTGRADWIACAAGRIAYGSGKSVTIEEARGENASRRSFQNDAAVSQAAFVGGRLFLAGDDGAIRDLSLGPVVASQVISLSPAPIGALHLSGMGSWLVVAEDEVGLRFLPVASTHPCAGSSAPEPGFLPLKMRFSALTAASRMVYAALSDGGLLEVDARDPVHAIVKRVIPYGGKVDGMAASPSRLYVLGERGLEVLEVGPGGASRGALRPDARGSSIQAAGRTIRIAGGEQGVVTYSDRSTAAQMFEVSVSDDIFSPPDVTVAVGDTVRWTNVSGDLHNVASCTPAQIGCNSATAAESFTSGPATGFWVFAHTFTLAGSNPYVCQPHATFMTGSVTVTGSSGAPPGVPDGRTGAPMLVSKLATDGSTLSLAWDVTTCSGAADHEILYGYAFGLPGSTGGGYELSGAQCSIGPSSPYTWVGVPPAFTGSSGYLYWLVVATDAVATEGSWGKDSAGAERAGVGEGGVSDECGMVVKSLTNGCPP